MSDDLDATLSLDTLRTLSQPVKADDIMAEAGRKILLADFIRMLDQAGRVLEDDAAEHVHQMRVATRRMRSAFRVLDTYYKSKPVQPFAQHLRKLARALGDVRDYDILLQDLARAAASVDADTADGLRVVADRLDKKRRRARKKLLALLNSEAYSKFVESYAAFLTHPGKNALPIDDQTVRPYQVRHVLPGILHEQLARVRAYDNVIVSDSVNGSTPQPLEVETLHALRIEFKRLRYLTSFFQDVLGASGEKFVDEIKTIQDYLGRLNDIVTAQAHLHALLDESSMDDSVFGGYLHQLASEQAELVAGFPAVWAHFNKRAVQSHLSNALLVLR